MKAKPSELTHVSASSIGLFQRCPKRWYYSYLLGIKGKTTDAMTRGSKVHEQLEKYLKDGTKPDENTTAGLIASKGLDLIPEPSEDNKIELSLAEFPVPGLPIPFKGFIDYLVTDAEDGIIEVGDHKTTSAWKWAKTEEELAENTQLIIYARHVLEHNPDALLIRLTHVYYLTRPPHGSKKVSVVVSRSHVYHEFNLILKVVQEMLDTAEQTLDHAPKNNKDCFAYGKRCTQYDECWHTITRTETLPMSNKQEDVLAFLRGETEAKEEALVQIDEPTGAVSPVEGPVTAPTHFTCDGVVIYIGCRPVSGSITPLYEQLEWMIEEICRRNGDVQHLSDIKYGRGYELLAQKFMSDGIPNGEYYMPSNTVLCHKLMDAMVAKAAKVVIAG